MKRSEEVTETLEVLNPEAPDFNCTPNQHFKHSDGCNSCTCAPDGKLARCTRKFCLPPEKREKRSDLLSLPNYDPTAPDFSCTPGERFRADCNRCKCQADGKRATCTRKLCLSPDNTPPPSTNTEVSRERRDTEPQHTLDPNAPDFSCLPNESFKHIDGCNTCSCLPDGKAAMCTLKLCLEPEKRDKRSDLYSLPNYNVHAPDFSCTPGEHFRDECNRCTCRNDGKTAKCTLRLCTPELESLTDRRKRSDLYSLRHIDTSAPDFSCTPGEKFRDDCNRCTCTADGKAAKCTLKLCPPPAATPERRKRSDLYSLKNLNPNSPDFSCTPGEQFRYDCNRCTCGQTGKLAACTFKLCPPEPQQLPVEPQQLPVERQKRSNNEEDANLPTLDPTAPNFICEPGKRFRHPDQCNFCTCSPNGKVARCTAKLCPENESPRNKRSNESKQLKTLDPSAQNFSCTPGESFKHIDGCNTCFCTPDGKRAGCTLIGCNVRIPIVQTNEVKPTKLEREKRELKTLDPTVKGFSCTPGQSFRHIDGCNTCVCQQNGRDAGCTLKLCLRKREATELKTLDPSVEGFSCTPGVSFRHIDGCNTCFCADDGKTAGCTEIGCISNLPQLVQIQETVEPKREKRELKTLDPTAAGFSCTPGESFRHIDGCNTCVCHQNGKVAGCTLKLCLRKREVSEAASEVTPTTITPEPDTAVSSTTVKSTVCTPGESYYDGCNWCSCGDDGLPHACTLRYCITLEESTRIKDLAKAIDEKGPVVVSSPSETETKTENAVDVNNVPGETAASRKKRDVMYKDPSAPNFSCSPGAQFYHVDGCNTCLCSGDGKTAACTLRQCLSPPTTTPRPGEVASIQTCVPGSKFLSDDGCNTCTCSLDGKQVGCTLMYCEKKTTPAPIGQVQRPDHLVGMIADRIQNIAQNNDRLIFARQT